MWQNGNTMLYNYYYDEQGQESRYKHKRIKRPQNKLEYQYFLIRR